MHPITDYEYIRYEIDFKNNLRAGIVTFIRTQFEFVFESPCCGMRHWCEQGRPTRTEMVALEIDCDLLQYS